METGPGGLEVVVDRAKCCGYGLCAEVCPEVYQLDDQGFVYVAGPVSPELTGAAREGAEVCPEEALTLRAVPSGS